MSLSRDTTESAFFASAASLPSIDEIDMEILRAGAVPQEPRSVPAGQRAVMYLRVSTRGQVETDYDPEGISIPAQRLACERKAEQLGLTLIDEYTELGQSATGTTKRLAFNQMLDRIRLERDVDYVIVYKLSRFARNRFDDAMTMAELQKRNVQLISATEQIDASPVGQLMHGILSTFNEYRSREDGADIAYKMGQKAKSGGTLGKAPLGYANTIERIDGRDIRSVAIDEERAPYVKLAFDLYATGNFTMEDIVEELTDQGLTTRATRQRPSGPVSSSKMSRLLRDRYYLGEVVYKGESFKGRHEQLIPHHVFDKVQTLLEGSGKAGERKMVHLHYLKGTVYCGACRRLREKNSRLIVQRTVNQYENEYLYFFCIDKQNSGPCRLSRHMAITDVEDLVIEHYKSVRLRPEFIETVRSSMDAALKEQKATQHEMRSHLGRQMKRIMVQIDNLLDLTAEGGIAAGRAKEKIRDLEYKRLDLDERLNSIHDDLTESVTLINEWLELLTDPYELYRKASDEMRRELNQAIFKHIYIASDESLGSELAAAARVLVETDRALLAIDATKQKPDDARAQGVNASPGESVEELLDVDLAQSSSKAYMVPLEGLEPPTLSLGRNCSSIELQRLGERVYRGGGYRKSATSDAGMVRCP